MPRTPTWLHAMLLWLAFTLVLFPVSGGLLYLGAYALGTQEQKREVSYPPPEDFPVLVVTPAGGASQYSAQVIYFRNLEKFLQAHPDASFLVPAGWESKLNQQLYASNRQGMQASGQGPDFDVPYSQAFTMERLGEGRQRLHVQAPIDDDEPDEAWYEAGAHSFTPRYHRHYITLGVSMGAALQAVPAAAIFSVLLAVLLAWWVEHKLHRRAAAAAVAQSKAAGA